MKRKFSVEQIVSVLKQAEVGLTYFCTCRVRTVSSIPSNAFDVAGSEQGTSNARIIIGTTISDRWPRFETGEEVTYADRHLI